MKRIWIVAVLVVMVTVIWFSYMSNQKAQANAELVALMVYGQTSIPTWRRPIPMPQVVDTLRDGQLTASYQARSSLVAEIAYIGSKPAGYYVSVFDPNAPDGRASVPKDDWLLEANIPLAALDAHIALLESQ